MLTCLSTGKSGMLLTGLISSPEIWTNGCLLALVASRIWGLYHAIIKDGRRIGSCRDLCGGIFAAFWAWGFVSGIGNSGSEDGG